MTSLLGLVVANGASYPLVSLPHRMSSPRKNSSVTFATNIQNCTMLHSSELHHPLIQDREGLPRYHLQNAMMLDLAKVTYAPVSIVIRHGLVSYLHLGN
jgi:hypothetical protein